MSTGTLVLYTDRSDRSAGLATALDRIVPCTVVAAQDPPHPAADRTGWLGVVASVDLLRPASARGLRALLTASGSKLPLICLLRSMSDRSFAEARALGASLCLPELTPPRTVVEAALAHVRPGGSVADAVVARSAQQAGTALTGMLDAARAGGSVDAGAVEAGLDPILYAVGEGGLDRWLDTVRAYDDATYQHCLLVAGLAATLAIDLGFTERDRQQLTRAALVHDVGKARIPLAILNKPGPLDAEERAVMREHAALGHEILVAAGGFDPVTLSVVRHHHELLDGSGYPDGISGAAIGDLVRLTTICDIYAALIERRPYRAPMPTMEAIGVLRGMTGKLDPDLLNAFQYTVTAGQAR